MAKLSLPAPLRCWWPQKEVEWDLLLQGLTPLPFSRMVQTVEGKTTEVHRENWESPT